MTVKTEKTERQAEPETGTRCPYEVCELRLRHLDEKLDRLISAIEGNGKPGLMLRVDRLEREIEPDIPKRVDRLEQVMGPWRSALRAAGYLICGGVVAAVGQHLLQHMAGK